MFGKQTESKSKSRGFEIRVCLETSSTDYFTYDFSGEALISSFLGDDDNNSIPDEPISHQFQMAKALSVLQIKASTFLSLHSSGKHDEVCVVLK